MKREDLKELGLEKDIIDKIMKMNGDDINGAKEDAKKDIDAKDVEIGKLNASIKDIQKDLKKYQDMDIDDIKKNAEDWETKFNDSQKEIQDLKNSTLLEKSLLTSNAHDTEMLLKALDHDKLNFTDGKVVGLEEQLKELKESKPFLFKEVEEDNGDNGSGFEMFNPGESNGSGSSTMESILDGVFKE